jgi:hypothetical protein
LLRLDVVSVTPDWLLKRVVDVELTALALRYAPQVGQFLLALSRRC